VVEGFVGRVQDKVGPLSNEQGVREVRFSRVVCRGPGNKHAWARGRWVAKDSESIRLQNLKPGGRGTNKEVGDKCK